MQTKFALNAAVCLHWCNWADEYVVFEETSGQTHILDTFRAFLLNAVSESPQTCDQLLLDISTVMSTDKSPELEGLVTGALLEFETLGLLERLPV